MAKHTDASEEVKAAALIAAAQMTGKPSVPGQEHEQMVAERAVKLLAAFDQALDEAGD